MKNTFFVSMFLLVALSLGALGDESISGTSKPTIGYPKDYAVASRKKIDAVFHSKRHKFVDASETLGASSYRMLRFRGDTVALNMFIDELSRCDSVTIDVLFRKPEESGKPNIELPDYIRGFDWVVHKPAGRNSFVIRINVASKNFDFEKFVFPQIRSTAAGDADARPREQP